MRDVYYRCTASFNLADRPSLTTADNNIDWTSSCQTSSLRIACMNSLSCSYEPRKTSMVLLTRLQIILFKTILLFIYPDWHTLLMPVWNSSCFSVRGLWSLCNIDIFLQAFALLAGCQEGHTVCKKISHRNPSGWRIYRVLGTTNKLSHSVFTKHLLSGRPLLLGASNGVVSLYIYHMVLCGQRRVSRQQRRCYLPAVSRWSRVNSSSRRQSSVARSSLVDCRFN